MTGIFRTILSMSIGAGVLGIMVLIARAIIGRRQTVAITLMFALLIARLIVPFNIESKASIFNLVPSEFAQTDTVGDTGFSEADNMYMPLIAAEQDVASADVTYAEYEPIANDAAAEDPATEDAQNVAVASEIKQPRSIDYWQLAAYAWAAGMAVLASIIFISNALFVRKVRGNRDYASPELIKIIDECAAQFGIKQKIRAVRMSEINNVAVCGIFVPMLLISPEAFEGLTAQEKRDVIMHEMSHIKRKDTLTSLILTIVSVLHWFNPIVWIAFAAYRKDMEVMCDIKVLARMQKWQRKSYAETLLKLAKTSNGRNPKLAMALFMSKSSIKRRITMIARYKKNKPIVAILALILALGIAVTGCTTRITDGLEETQGQEPISLEQQESTKETQEQQTFEPELLASYTFDYSEYANDQARVHNIRKAASALNGVTIAPDEQVGIIETIGSITMDDGWQKAPGITWETISKLVDSGDVNNESVLSANPIFEQVGGGADLVVAAFCLACIDAGVDYGLSWSSGYIYDGDAGLHNWFDAQVVFEAIQEDNKLIVNLYGPGNFDEQRIKWINKHSSINYLSDIAADQYELGGSYNEEAVRKALLRLDCIEINPGETISLREIAGYYGERNDFKAESDIEEAHNESGMGGETCIIASVIYEASLRAGLEIIEVTHHTYLPDGLEAVFEVSFSEVGGELKIKNPYNEKVVIYTSHSFGYIHCDIAGPEIDERIEFKLIGGEEGERLPPDIHYNEFFLPNGVIISENEGAVYVEGSGKSSYRLYKLIFDKEGNVLDSSLFTTVNYEAYPDQIYVNGDTVPDDMK